VDRPFQALVPPDARPPAEPLSREPGVGPGTRGVVDRALDEPDARDGADEVDDAAGEVEDGDLLAALA
jgi:hypothetical protein